jgi:general secretion pathway protein M
MNPLSQAVTQLKTSASVFWLARSEQEHKLLGAAAAVVVLALVYALAIAPAAAGRARLEKSLPELRLQAAQMQALAAEAAQLAGQTAPAVQPMSRETLAASLAARSLTAQSLSLTGEYVKVQFAGAPFAAVMGWLAGLRSEQRIALQDASFTAQTTPGQVDATLTLHQSMGEAR